MPTAALTTDSHKSERIEARVSPGFKLMVERAAALTGHTLSSFLLFALQSSARQVTEDHTLAVLSAKESMAVAKALLHPGPPNPRLRSADARYRKLVKSIG